MIETIIIAKVDFLRDPFQGFSFLYSNPDPHLSSDPSLASEWRVDDDSISLNLLIGSMLERSRL